MPESTQRVGQFDMRIEFAAPAEGQQDRVEVLTAWLLVQWEAAQTEEEHGIERAAG